jgi:hypothetical protein
MKARKARQTDQAILHQGVHLLGRLGLEIISATMREESDLSRQMRLEYDRRWPAREISQVAVAFRIFDLHRMADPVNKK